MNTGAPQPVDLPQELAGENRTDPAKPLMNVTPETERKLVDEVTKLS